MYWAFDQSLCHKAYGEDALNVDKMNMYGQGVVNPKCMIPDNGKIHGADYGIQ